MGLTSESRQSSSKRFRDKALIAVAAALALVFGTQGAAFAASWKAISGTTYSTGGGWYVSDTIRTKDGTGGVSGKFSSLPRMGGVTAPYDGLMYNIRQTAAAGGAILGLTRTFTTTGTQQSFTTLGSGTQFRGAFARVNTCNSCQHGFAGDLYY